MLILSHICPCICPSTHPPITDQTLRKNGYILAVGSISPPPLSRTPRRADRDSRSPQSSRKRTRVQRSRSIPAPLSPSVFLLLPPPTSVPPPVLRHPGEEAELCSPLQVRIMSSRSPHIPSPPPGVGSRARDLGTDRRHVTVRAPKGCSPDGPLCLCVAPFFFPAGDRSACTALNAGSLPG